jgi:hypothetical protein
LTSFTRLLRTVKSANNNKTSGLTAYAVRTLYSWELALCATYVLKKIHSGCQECKRCPRVHNLGHTLATRAGHDIVSLFAWGLGNVRWKDSKCFMKVGDASIFEIGGNAAYPPFQLNTVISKFYCHVFYGKLSFLSSVRAVELMICSTGPTSLLAVSEVRCGK